MQKARSMARAHKKLVEENTIDIKSHLSIVAHSAIVEIWIIDEDLLGLLPA